METALWTFTLSAASALAFLAYKHPVSYERFGWRLGILSVLLNFLMLAWREGRDSLTLALIEEFQLHPERVAAFVEPSRDLLNIVMIVVGLAGLYAMMLMALPWVIDLDEPKKRYD
ncbi:hypothetical protein [Aurantimonas endophytica]|uniref:Uncharacterized protein n=1 Tax=Aurantimonas endophytica TaxID=1522175 RepID=A0A7W6HFB0_9HYPH|nr:hypothetical protein [Aurantimonas endophytica]MBB4003883.1 hypothetical protein [Aurantimonas endophytica]MCO6404734.1 hypothetical protein [Aurantimonas endophytica]